MANYKILFRIHVDSGFSSTSQLILIQQINNQEYCKKKAKNKKAKTVNLNLYFQFLFVEKALNINKIKTKTMALMVAVGRKLCFILLVSE